VKLQNPVISIITFFDVIYNITMEE